MDKSRRIHNYMPSIQREASRLWTSPREMEFSTMRIHWLEIEQRQYYVWREENRYHVDHSSRRPNWKRFWINQKQCTLCKEVLRSRSTFSSREQLSKQRQNHKHAKMDRIVVARMLRATRVENHLTTLVLLPRLCRVLHHWSHVKYKHLWFIHGD